MIFTRPPVELCSTYFDTAKMIAELPFDDNFELVAATLIKLYGHHEKLSVYQRLAYFSDDAGPFLKKILEQKVRTHQTILEQWDTGKWKPTV